MSIANKIVVGLVGLTVMAVVFTAMLPIMGEVTSAETTFKNEGYFYLDKFTSSDDYTLVWDSSDPYTFVINDETITYKNTSGNAVSIALGTTFAIRLNNNNASISFYGNGTWVSTSVTYPTFEFTYSGGTIIATNTDTTKTITSVDLIYGLVDKGNYVMKVSDAVAYLNSGSEVVADSEIYASGQTFNGGANVFWHLEGTIEDLDYPDTFNNTYTITNEVIHGGYSTTHNDLYELDNITFTLTNSSEVVFDITASYFVVPAEVTAEKTIHPDGPTTAILNILPLVIVAGLVIGGIAFMIVTRK